MLGRGGTISSLEAGSTFTTFISLMLLEPMKVYSQFSLSVYQSRQNIFHWVPVKLLFMLQMKFWFLFEWLILLLLMWKLFTKLNNSLLAERRKQLLCLRYSQQMEFNPSITGSILSTQRMVKPGGISITINLSTLVLNIGRILDPFSSSSDYDEYSLYSSQGPLLSIFSSISSYMSLIRREDSFRQTSSSHSLLSMILSFLREVLNLGGDQRCIIQISSSSLSGSWCLLLTKVR